MGKTLVAFDTDHIKQYVFGTDKLKEIRGASSILDYLNRTVMTGKEKNKPLPFRVNPVYANGGGGLFVIESDNADDAENFERYIQREYRERTGEGASITYAVQKLPDDIKITRNDDIEGELVDDEKIESFLESLRWRLREKKLIASEMISFPTHPFMRPCDSCGVFYAAPDEGRVNRDPDERTQGELYCLSCQLKRQRDEQVKQYIDDVVRGDKTSSDDFLWKEVRDRLEKAGYDLSSHPKRPEDFNVFANFKGKKDYLALIYADANSMGSSFEKCKGLKEYQILAKTVDDAIYQAVCSAIAQQLKVKDHVPAGLQPTFPFDILLMGGDDVLMAVPATVALDVALTIANVFEKEMGKHYPDKQYTLSVGVVIAPIKYPFRLLESLVTTTLKFAKDDGEGKPRINFVTVAGSASETFTKVFDLLRDETADKQFFATLRPYDPATLRHLLDAIRDGRRQNLGRSKLHQMREAILKMNLTASSVGESLAILMNWRPSQRDNVITYVNALANQYLIDKKGPQNLDSLHYDRPFPWFYVENKQGRDIYRTPLLHFI